MSKIACAFKEYASSVAFCLALITNVFVIGPASAAAESAPRLHFAGFAMWGNAADASTSFPYTSELLSRNGEELVRLNKALVARLNSEGYQNISISTDLANYKAGSALVVACVLVWENVSVEVVGSVIKVSVDLQAQALVFDYTTRQVVAVYPFGTQYIDVVSRPPDRRELIAAFKSQLTRDNGISGAFARALHRIQIRDGFGKRIQLKSVSVSDAAASQLSQSGLDPRQARLVLQHAFERYLSANGEVPIVPYSNNQAIGGTMALRLMNGDVFNLTLPEADYHVSVVLENARKVEISQTKSGSGIAFASYLNASVIQPLSGTKFLDGSFKFAIVKVVSRDSTIDESSAFQESLLSISDQLTKQFRAPSEEWSEQWVVRLSDDDAFERVSELLEQCR